MVCYAAGFVTVLLLPALAKSTYISENALMPGPIFVATYIFLLGFGWKILHEALDLSCNAIPTPDKSGHGVSFFVAHTFF